jgi:hypothetical protein
VSGEGEKVKGGKVKGGKVKGEPGTTEIPLY